MPVQAPQQRKPVSPDSHTLCLFGSSNVTACRLNRTDWYVKPNTPALPHCDALLSWVSIPALLLAGGACGSAMMR